MSKQSFEGSNLYQKIVDSSEEGVWLIDVKGNTLFANKKLGEILGYEPEEMLGRTMYEFMHKEEIELAEQNLKKRESGVSEHHDFLFRKKDGSKVWVSIAAGPFYNEQGEYVGALGMVTDISERRITEIMLQSQRNLLETLVMGSTLEMALNQLIHGIENLVEGVKCSILLIDEEGKRLWKGAAPTLPDDYNYAIHGAPIGPKAGSCGTSAYTKKMVIVTDTQTDPLWEDYKELAWKFNLLSSWSSPIITEDGRVLGTFALYFNTNRSPSLLEMNIVRDATSAATVAIDFVNKREKDKLNKQRTTFLAESRKVLGSSLDLNFLLDSIPKIVVPFMADHCFIGLTKDSDLPEVLMRSINSGEVEVYQNDSRWDWSFLGLKQISSCLTLPMIVRGKVIGGLVLVFTDPKRIYQPMDLELASEFCFSCGIAIDNATLFDQTKTSLVLRDEFLAVASHELRTPLTILRGRIDLLTLMVQKKFIPPEVGSKIHQTLQTSHNQVNQLSKLVDNLLDFRKFGEAEIKLKKEKLFLSQIIKDQVSNFDSQIQQKNSQVIYDMDARIEGLWDKSRLEQVFVNLLTNALKFGPGPKLEISTALANGNAIIKFRDYGIGIPLKDQKRIFERFERAVSGNYFSGLGLGLYITRQIIQAHGGEIHVESEENKGATFILKLPLIAA